MRCLSHAKSGHQFLQHHADHGDINIDPSHFFKALSSKRCLKNISSLNELLCATMQRELSDPFAEFRELKDYDIYAADGHYHHAAAFDPKPTNRSEKANATAHFFRLDLRSHHLGHLKHTVGIYFITREKSNSVATICSRNLIDKNDPRNVGIEGDFFVGGNNSEVLRRINYTNPTDGASYTYLTNEFKIPAYQMVIIYKKRWVLKKFSIN